MINIRTYILRASSVIGLMLFLFGCASYNDRILPYYKNISAGNYKEAETQLDKNSLIQKPRNRLLYLMEKGRVAHLNGEYESSNKYFNEADQMLEQGLTSASDAAVGVLLNPMSQRYKGEDFEKFMKDNAGAEYNPLRQAKQFGRNVVKQIAEIPKTLAIVDSALDDAQQKLLPEERGVIL